MGAPYPLIYQLDPAAEPPGRQYTVARRDTRVRIGTVAPVAVASHIRRGRDQVTPWWQARCSKGHPVSSPANLRGRPDATMWPRRRQAGEALVRHVEQYHR
jgi:hypothetical protein